MFSLTSIALLSTLGVGIALCYGAADSRQSSSSREQSALTAFTGQKEEADRFERATKTNRSRTFSEPDAIIIETKFVEIGSTTEELDFDWIVSQFDFHDFSTQN